MNIPLFSFISRSFLELFFIVIEPWAFVIVEVFFIALEVIILSKIYIYHKHIVWELSSHFRYKLYGTCVCSWDRLSFMIFCQMLCIIGIWIQFSLSFLFCPSFRSFELALMVLAFTLIFLVHRFQNLISGLLPFFFLSIQQRNVSDSHQRFIWLQCFCP